jgi:sulfite exporter TauE/SafE
MELLFTALGLGLLTGFHCIGMCGPIAIALPLNNKSWTTRIISGLTYNIGRTVTYAIMGLLFGLIGVGFSMAGFQRWVTIIMGIFMISTVVFPSLSHTLYRGSGNSKFMSAVRSQLQKYFRQASYKALFITGLLNGLLPCGMVYMALAGAISQDSLTDSVMYMILFGLGTIPMMLLLSLLGNIAGARVKRFVNKAIPYVVVIIGTLFILRGMELGIKFISPPAKKLELQNHIKPMKETNTVLMKPCCEHES